nr:MAG TPA: hypothetical protein [Caudoviricetes sp.]
MQLVYKFDINHSDKLCAFAVSMLMSTVRLI